MMEPFERAILSAPSAQYDSCNATTQCMYRFSKAKCDASRGFHLTAAPAVARLLDEQQPDALIINTGIWHAYAKVYPPVSPLQDIDEMAATIRSAIARRAGSKRPLRVVWKSTTAIVNASYSTITRELQRILESALVAAGAEVFDAYDLTLGLVANAEIAKAALFDPLHVGPAGHAEVNAALVMHLVNGWRAH